MKEKISSRYSFDKLCELAELGEQVEIRLPSLVGMLMGEKPKKAKVKRERKQRQALGQGLGETDGAKEAN